MSDITFFERKKLETLFDMSGGYVLGLSTRELTEFVQESVGKDIQDDAYRYESSSKANRMRAFWSREPNPVVGKLVADLIAYAKSEMNSPDDALVSGCEAVASRLLGPQPPVPESKLVWKKQFDEGLHARIWEAEDELGRRVAVKIYEASMEFLGPALVQAKALARVRHPNVVLVYTTCTVEHPAEPGRLVTAIVMEYLEGKPLLNLFRGPALKAATCRSIGTQIVAGIRAIHDAGLTHGDLHERNVIVDGESVKIIDILYLDTLDAMSTTSKDMRFKRDRSKVRDLLTALLTHSELPIENERSFLSNVGEESSLDDVERAFVAATERMSSEQLEWRIESAFQRVVDERFLPSASYAAALADETPDGVVFPLLVRLLDDWAARPVHKEYLSLLWDRLTSDQRKSVVLRASGLFDEVPRPRWVSFLVPLAAFGAVGWRLIPRARRLQLEHEIVTDIASGRVDIYGIRTRGGELGTWAIHFGEHFEERDQLSNALCDALNGDWYTQNYIGQYLLPLIPRIADTEERERRLLAALDAAVRNDAKVVKKNAERILTTDGRFRRGARS